MINYFTILTKNIKTAIITAFILLLSGCITAAPYQTFSEAQQALEASKEILSQKQSTTINLTDEKDYIIATSLLKDAEKAIKKAQYKTASALVKESKKHSHVTLSSVINRQPILYQTIFCK